MQRGPEGLESKIRGTITAIDPIEKRSDIDQLSPRIHEIEIEEFLAVHEEKMGAAEASGPGGAAKVW